MKKILLLVSIYLSASVSYSQQPKPALNVTPLAKNFYVHISYGMVGNTLFPSNGLIVDGDSVLLIDTGWDTAQTQQILDWIKTNLHKSVAYCIVTHWHEDRTAGIGLLQQNGIKVFATAATNEKLVKEHNRHADIILPVDTVFNIGHLKLNTYFPGAGHTADNIVVWFPGQKILFGGCLVKSTEATNLGNLADADVEQWPAGIRHVIEKFGNAAYVIPGHQSWADKKSLQYTLELLQKK